MRMIKVSATVLAVIALVGVSAALPVPASAACKPDITREAIGNFQFSTRLTARNRWRAAVRKKYGSKFAVWTRAADRKTEECTKKGPGGKWVCVASARPCD